MRITDDGNVGIGTTSPGTKLDVTTVANTAGIRVTAPNTTSQSFGATIAAGTNSSDYAFNINNAAGTGILRVRGDGNVGIGTTAPTHKLHTSTSATGVYIQREISSNAANLSEFNSNRSLIIKNRTGGSFLMFGGNGSRTDIQATDGAGTPTAKNIALNPFGGNVGIGTTSPDRQLELEGQGVLRLNATGSNTDPGIDFNTSSTNDMQIRYRGTTDKLAIYSYGTSSDVVTIQKSDGKVGIGTTAPNYKLHVKETTTNAGGIQVDDGTSWLKIVPSLGGGGFNPIATAGDIGLIFSTDNDVSSDTTAGLLIAPHSSNAGGMKILENGKIGIGTTSPNTLLHLTKASGGAVLRLENPDTGVSTDEIIGKIEFEQQDNGGPGVNSYIGSFGANVNGGAYLAFGTGTSPSTLAERMRIISDGNVLMGKTANDNTTAGHRFSPNGFVSHVRDGFEPMILNRLSSNGSILKLRKDGGEIGSLATVDGDLNIHAAASGHKGLRFGNGYIAPTANSTAVENNTVDLGLSTHRFKDLYLAGTANVGGNLVVTGDLTINGTTTTLNTATLNVEDKNIVLNYGTGDTTSTADGAGITIQDAVDASTDAAIQWNTGNDRFNFTHGIRLPDSKKMQFGDGSDLFIEHDGNNSVIRNTTGNLYIQNGTSGVILIQPVNNEASITAHANGAVELYHNGGKKFETTSTGASITGKTTFSDDITVGHATTGTHSTTTTATTGTAIASFGKTSFRSAKYLVQVTNTTDSTYHVTEILIIHDGTDTYMTEYGSMFTGTAAEATFTSDISGGGSVRLLATPASTDSMTFKVIRQNITV